MGLSSSSSSYIIKVCISFLCPRCSLNLLNCGTPFKFRTLSYSLYIWMLSLFSLRNCQLDFSQVEVLDAACFAHSLLHIRICLGHLKVPHVCWYWVLGKGGLHRSIIRLSPEAGINKISQRSSYLWPHIFFAQELQLQVKMGRIKLIVKSVCNTCW